MKTLIVLSLLIGSVALAGDSPSVPVDGNREESKPKTTRVNTKESTSKVSTATRQAPATYTSRGLSRVNLRRPTTTVTSRTVGSSNTQTTPTAGGN